VRLHQLRVRSRVSCESDNERGTTQRKRENAVPHVSKYSRLVGRDSHLINYKLEWYGCLGSAWSYIEKPYKMDLQKDVQYFACKWYRKKSVENNVIQDARENRAKFNKKKKKNARISRKGLMMNAKLQFLPRYSLPLLSFLFCIKQILPVFIARSKESLIGRSGKEESPRPAERRPMLLESLSDRRTAAEAKGACRG